MTDYAALRQAVMKGRRNDVAGLVQAAVNAGEELTALLDEALIPAMRAIGDQFSRGEVYVPELLIAARAMQAGLAILEPRLAAGGHEPIGIIAIGTVKGDLHDIGKNLVAILLRGAGYHTIDLGVNCDIARFEEGAARGARILAVSALLTTTMPYMKEVVAHFRPLGVKVIVGGAPVTQAFADEIGADGFSENAADAVRLVKALYPA